MTGADDELGRALQSVVNKKASLAATDAKIKRELEEAEEARAAAYKLWNDSIVPGIVAATEMLREKLKPAGLAINKASITSRKGIQAIQAYHVEGGIDGIFSIEIVLDGDGIVHIGTGGSENKIPIYNIMDHMHFFYSEFSRIIIKKISA